MIGSTRTLVCTTYLPDHLQSSLVATGVRERWARNKGTLRHGIVEWDLKFTFVVDVPADGAVEGARFGVPGRLLQDRALEVRCCMCPATLGSRVQFASLACSELHQQSFTFASEICDVGCSWLDAATCWVVAQAPPDHFKKQSQLDIDLACR